MSGPSSTPSRTKQSNPVSVAALLAIAAVSFLLLLLWAFGTQLSDHYIRNTLELKGSKEQGYRLFRMNCVGCHGISGQGLVGPDLRQITFRRSDSRLIKQVISGSTPPMPSFELEPQEMADILSYLHTLS